MRCWRSTRSKRNIRIIEEGKVCRRWIIGLIFSFVFRCNQLGLTSRIFFPEHNHCPHTRIKCGTEKIELGHRTNPHANWSRTGFPEKHPSSGFTAGRKDVKIASEGALENHTALEVHIRQKRRRRTAICRDKFFAITDGFRRRIICFPELNDSQFFKSVLNICSHIFRKTTHSRACHSGQCKVLKLQPFRSGLDPIRGQCWFLLNTQTGKVQEVTDQRILPILKCLNWNHSSS